MAARFANPVVAISAGLCALACVLPAARGQRTGADTPAHESGDVSWRPVFSDDFAQPQLDRARWIAARGSRVLDETDVPAARLTAPLARRGGSVLLQSRPIALEAGAALLSYRVSMSAGPYDAALAVEYTTRTAGWGELDRVSAAEALAAPGWVERTVLLPVDALHEACSLRFRLSDASATSIWLLREVTLQTTRDRHTLTVRSTPLPDVPIALAGPGRSAGTRQITPWSLAMGPTAQVVVVAPAASDGWVFSHWSVNDRPEADRLRLLAVSPDGPVEAVAHYWPAGVAQETCNVSIRAAPPHEVVVEVGLRPECPHRRMHAGSRMTALLGETLVLDLPMTPEESEEHAFVRWVVQGADEPVGRREVQIRLEGDVQAVAEFALLGDMNGDGVLDKLDVDAFVMALAVSTAVPGLRVRGDVNRDGALDELDVEPFVARMLAP